MAKTLLFDRLGGPEVLELRVMETRAPGEGEVKLRVEAVGLNRAELMYMAGQYFEQPAFPSRIGYEPVGFVEEVGPGVDLSLKGRRMGTVPGYSMNKNGVLGEEAVVPVSQLAPIPEKLSSAEGAAVWMQYMTAYGALVMHGKAGKGDFVLITAASSSVGLAAIQIAKAAGAVAIATTRRGDKREALLAAGADFVIATEEEDLPARVGEITGGKLARIVFDPIGGPMMEKLAGAAAHGGTIYLYGVLSPEPTPFPVMLAMGKSLRIQGYTLFDIVADAGEFEAAKRYIVEGLEEGRLFPKVARTFPLEQTVEAYRFLASNQQIGKVVITVP